MTQCITNFTGWCGREDNDGLVRGASDPAEDFCRCQTAGFAGRREINADGMHPRIIHYGVHRFCKLLCVRRREVACGQVDRIVHRADIGNNLGEAHLCVFCQLTHPNTHAITGVCKHDSGSTGYAHHRGTSTRWILAGR